MSEKIEFIAAKDLPVAEGDEVDVLCVENGELKRKEGTSLGGSGGVLTVEMTVSGAWTSPNSVTFSHTYAEMRTVLDTGGIVLVWGHLTDWDDNQMYQHNNSYFKPMFAHGTTINGIGCITITPCYDYTVSSYSNYYIYEDGTSGYYGD